MEVAPFFVDFHHFLSIFTIFYQFSRFTHFCRDLHFVAIYALFPQNFFGQNSLLRNITRFFACMSSSSLFHISPRLVLYRHLILLTSSMHVLFMREHNRIAKLVGKYLPKNLRQDELIYQVT